MTYVPVLVGSIRLGRNTPRLANLIRRKLAEIEGVESGLIDLLELDLPMLHERLRNLEDPPAALVRLGAEIDRAAAVAIATPEYNKGYPAALKNALDGLGPEWKRKPVGIATHSTGSFGGNVALQHLRPVLMGLGAVPIPATLTVPKIREAIAEDGTPADEAFERRGAAFASELVRYARVMAQLREATAEEN